MALRRILSGRSGRSRAFSGQETQTSATAYIDEADNILSAASMDCAAISSELKATNPDLSKILMEISDDLDKAREMLKTY